MKIGIIMAIRNHPDAPCPLNEIYEDFIGDCLLAEKLGFDFAWFGEHHFTPCQWTPSPLIVASAVAAKTEKLRVGTSVLCLPFHNPIRVAEDVAVIDIISKGRFDFGIGLGSQFEEYRTFGVPVKERFGRTYEAMDVIEKCWYGDGEFSHKGKYYDFPNVNFTTKPYQNPIPVWVGAQEPQSVEETAKRGYHLLAGNAANYDAALQKHGRNPDEFLVAPMQQMTIAPNADEAWDSSLEGLHYFINFYRLRRDTKGDLPPASNEITREMIRNSGGPGGGTGMFLVGNPDQVRDGAVAVKNSQRITHMPIGFRHAGMKTADVHRSMELFAKEVMPALV